jgi:hypothetical protein
VSKAMGKSALLSYNPIVEYYTIKCGVCPEDFCERKQAKTGIDVNEQA